ncbi:Stathmin-4 [Atta colombica]|uniref:Stathmin-4 n=1 Tax=Atta colombica TaxID=520822 RepID=A0A195BK96_9HYME|nr:Stathmin-4 [Atta colombica]
MSVVEEEVAVSLHQTADNGSGARRGPSSLTSTRSSCGTPRIANNTPLSVVLVVVTIVGWSWLAGRVACRRRGKEEEKEKEEEESGRILSDAGRRGAACGPVALQPPPQLRLASDISGVPNSSLFWSSPLHLVLPATRDLVSRDPIVEITCPETPFAKQPPRTNRNNNMLIGLVRDSVLQCFCHSCKAPLGVVAGQRRNNAPFKKPSGKGKPRTKQPKKVKFITTEIRCQEKSKGGLCYEVILAEPTVPKRAPSPPQQSPTQQTAIEDKLKAAEERRLSIEAHKLAALAAKLSKIEEASRKKDELSAAFIAATRESLDAKMNNTEEKREAHIAELKNKLKDHLESVEKTRLSLEQQTEEVRCAVEEKLKTAAAQRDENIKRMLDRLKEHEEQVARVRQGMSERVQQLESQIQGKLEQARERRETIEREQKEKLRNHKENNKKANRVTSDCPEDFLRKKALIECRRLCDGGLEHGEDSENASDGGARAPDEKVRVRQEGVDRGDESATRDPASRAGDSPPPCNFVPTRIFNRNRTPADNLSYDLCKSMLAIRKIAKRFLRMISLIS